VEVTTLKSSASSLLDSLVAKVLAAEDAPKATSIGSKGPTWPCQFYYELL
jgi:hypothetical protein